MSRTHEAYWASRGRRIAGDLADPRGFAALVTSYLDWLSSHNYSECTVFGRANALRLLVEWLELRGIERPQDVTKPVLERYQRHLFHYRRPSGRPLAFSSQRVRLVAVQMFFKWLARHNLLLSNPAADLDLPRLERRLPKAILSAQEAESVLAAVDLEEPLALRDRALLETFYSTGIRRSELLALRLTDLDAERGTLLVRQGKGKKDRMLPIGKRAVAWVERYVEALRPKLVVEPDPGYLFLTEDGGPFTPDFLSRLVRACVDRAALGKTGSCHLFRHTMATLMLENGADIRFIQAMLGHACLNSTELYTQVSIRKLKAVHEATHPACLEQTGPQAAPSAARPARRALGQVLEQDAAEDLEPR